MKVLVSLLLTLGAPAFSEVQVPASVKKKAGVINDRFAQVLEEECAHGKCYPVGCEVSRFNTIDRRQDSSLPGLETTGDPKVKTQYRLASMRCEFSYEESMNAADLNTVRQRVLQRIKPVGVAISLISRKLKSKPAELPVTNPLAKPSLSETMVPFVPWFMAAVLLVLLGLSLLWAWRRLGREKPEARTELAATNPETVVEHYRPQPSSHMVLSRIEQLRADLDKDPKIAEQVLKAYFDTESYGELVFFVRHFGPAYLNTLKKEAEYREAFNELSRRYNEESADESLADVWQLLDNLERHIVATQVKIEHSSLESEFAFLSAITVDELSGMLKELSEAESVVVLAHAPSVLREQVFIGAGPVFAAKIIEQIARVDKLPDSYVREVARKLRKIYNAKQGELKTVRIDRVPLLEEALNSLAPSQRKNIVADIEKETPKFFKELSPLMFFDESLTKIPEDLITEAFMRVSPREGMSYLASLGENREMILRKMKPKLRESIERIRSEKIDPEEGNRARTQIASFFKDKHADGSIDLRRINESLIS